MAAVSVTTSKTATLAANTADTVTFAGAPLTPRCEIVNLDSSSIIWARVDGSAATVAGDECVPIPPSSSWIPAGSPASISLISSGAAQYTVDKLV